MCLSLEEKCTLQKCKYLFKSGVSTICGTFKKKGPRPIFRPFLEDMCCLCLCGVPWSVRCVMSCFLTWGIFHLTVPKMEKQMTVLGRPCPYDDSWEKHFSDAHKHKEKEAQTEKGSELAATLYESVARNVSNFVNTSRTKWPGNNKWRTVTVSRTEKAEK